MYCNKCGKEIPNDSKVCKYCGATLIDTQTVNYNINTAQNNKVKKKIYQQWWFWLIIVFLIIGIIGTSTGSNENVTTGNNTAVSNNKSNNTANIQNEKVPELSKEDYQKQCKKYDYKELARNPNNYKNKKVKFTGEVIQVQEGWFNSVVLRVNVTKGEYGFWEDTMWVDYTYKDENESKILEDDIINIYGEFKGQKTYTSVLGSNVSIPQVEAKYISLNKK